MRRWQTGNTWGGARDVRNKAWGDGVSGMGPGRSQPSLSHSRDRGAALRPARRSPWQLTVDKKQHNRRRAPPPPASKPKIRQWFYSECGILIVLFAHLSAWTFLTLIIYAFPPEILGFSLAIFAYFPPYFCLLRNFRHL